MLNNIEPKEVWKNFELLNAVPRASKKEAEVIAFMKAFGENLNLQTYVDEVGNVIIKKPASKGMETKPTVALQTHLDMVHQKNNDTIFDFATEGIKMYIDEDWVKAKGTTLGADNGLGVAAVMAILESNEIVHPALEALFTIDEETGMTGAKALKGGLLDAKYMLNLDTEEDDDITIGCAGGIDITGSATYEVVAALHNSNGYKISLTGLSGGHSGVDIHKGIANANKLMNRFLWDLDQKNILQIVSLEGGSLRNAIPRESIAVVNITDEKILEGAVNSFQTMYKNEYAVTDPNLSLKFEKLSTAESGVGAEFQEKLLNALYNLPNGIYRMDSSIEGLVQTSNNLAKVNIGAGSFTAKCLCRSSVETEKMDMANAIKSSFSLMGATTTFAGTYPGWQPMPHSDLVKMLVAKYKELNNGEAPTVSAIHAGLECGIIGTNYPNTQMISFGPTIHGAHSPDERASISSSQKFWKYLLELLKSF